MGGCHCKLQDTTDIKTLNAIKGHFEEQWLPGDLHVDTVWKTLLLLILIQIGGLGGFKLIRWYRKKRAAKKAARAKGVWDQWYERNRPPQPRAYYPTAPPEYYPSAPPCQPFPEDYPEWGMAQNRQMTGRWAQWAREEEGEAARRGRAGNARPRPQQALHQPGAPHPPHTQPGEGYPGSAPPGTGGATGHHHRDTNEEGQDEMDKTLSQAVIKQEH